MRDLEDYRCYLKCRLEIAQSFFLQEVKPGSSEEAEQWMIKGRILEIEKLIEKLAEVSNESA